MEINFARSRNNITAGFLPDSLLKYTFSKDRRKFCFIVKLYQSLLAF